MAAGSKLSTIKLKSILPNVLQRSVETHHNGGNSWREPYDDASDGECLSSPTLLGHRWQQALKPKLFTIKIKHFEKSQLPYWFFLSDKHSNFGIEKWASDAIFMFSSWEMMSLKVWFWNNHTFTELYTTAVCCGCEWVRASSKIRAS